MNPDDIDWKAYLHQSNTWDIEERLARLRPEASAGDRYAVIESILLVREKWHRETWWMRRMSFGSQVCS